MTEILRWKNDIKNKFLKIEVYVNFYKNYFYKTCDFKLCHIFLKIKNNIMRLYLKVTIKKKTEQSLPGKIVGNDEVYNFLYVLHSI